MSLSETTLRKRAAALGLEIHRGYRKKNGTYDGYELDEAGGRVRGYYILNGMSGYVSAGLEQGILYTLTLDDVERYLDRMERKKTIDRIFRR